MRKRSKSSMTDAPEVQIDCRFFAYDVVACEANIRRRNRMSIGQDLTKLQVYSLLYRIPQRAYVLPIGGKPNIRFFRSYTTLNLT